MSKFISIITARSNSTPAVHNSQTQLPSDENTSANSKKIQSTPMSRKPSSFSKKSSLSVNTSDVSAESMNMKPKVKSPDWSIRYDPTLSVYYYVNEKTNEIQFDHPDEVVSPTASPITKQDSLNNSSAFYDTDHRKIFSTSLKRTLSPKFFSNNNSNKHTRSKSNSPRASSEIKQSSNTIPKNSIGTLADDDMDEDVEEFRKQLELEMKTYECERLRST